MNRAYRIVPTHTGDVSGVCSALFELGGMVVIHDPSGCNSTYNTHDEIRWYDQDSLIFISGLSQMDAILGDDEKLIREIVDAAEKLHPAFLALASSPIPYLNGTDFKAIARLLEGRLHIPVFFVQTNGMHDYVTGGGNALLMVAKRLVPEPQAANVPPNQEEGSVKSQIPCPTLNLLGVTPLDFAAKGSVESLHAFVQAAGWKVQSCWAMGDTLTDLQSAGSADLNLVVSALGLPAARELKRRFGIPYVVGCPIGRFADELRKQMKETLQDGRNRIAYNRMAGSLDLVSDQSAETRQHLTAPVRIIGEPVTSASLAYALTLKYDCWTQVICPLETAPELITSDILLVDGEEEIESAIQGAEHLIADPLYRPIAPQTAVFHDLPTLALSGRGFLRQAKNLMEVLPT